MGFIKSMFSFSGYMDRAEYWHAVIFYIFFPFFACLICAFLCGWYDFSGSGIVLHPVIKGEPLTLITTILTFYIIYAFTIGMFFVMAKRMRDISMTPLMGLLYFIPPLSVFVVIFFGMLQTNVRAYER